jgi:hypothetical protein
MILFGFLELIMLVLQPKMWSRRNWQENESAGRISEEKNSCRKYGNGKMNMLLISMAK